MGDVLPIQAPRGQGVQTNYWIGFIPTVLDVPEAVISGALVMLFEQHDSPFCKGGSYATLGGVVHIGERLIIPSRNYVLIKRRL